MSRVDKRRAWKALQYADAYGGPRKSTNVTELSAFKDPMLKWYLENGCKPEFISDSVIIELPPVPLQEWDQ